MTGPEHYREAEQHIHFAKRSGDNPDIERIHLDYAQVHATLALAAANALRTGLPWEDFTAWNEVAGVPSKAVNGRG